MQIAVFGGTGFIGEHTCMALAARGHGVVAISRGSLAEGGGVEHRRCDASRGIAPEVLAGCDVVVNLIGVKRARADLSFSAAHVEATRHIVAAMREANLARLVHVSVCTPGDPDGDPYLETKQRGEQVVRESGLRWTILRPGVVYGEGDDMIHHLVRTVRHTPVFPAPDGGRAQLAIVDVEDVADAIAACVEREASVERIYDIVGPERVTVRALVERVAAVTASPTRVLAVPAALLRPAAAIMEALLHDPPITRAQLNLLRRGVVGDPEPARAELAIDSRALGHERLHALAEAPRNRSPAFGISLRGGWPARMLLGIALLNAASLLSITGGAADHWWRVGATYLVAFAVLARWFRLPWRELLAPRSVALAAGLAGGAFSFALTAVGAALAFSLAPTLREQAASVYAWAGALPLHVAVPTLIAIVAAEDVFWRAGVGFSIARQGCTTLAIAIAALGFAAAHLALGPPLLWLAAALGGAFWTWLLIRTRSLLAAFVAHLTWDVAVLWLWPLA